MCGWCHGNSTAAAPALPAQEADHQARVRVLGYQQRAVQQVDLVLRPLQMLPVLLQSAQPPASALAGLKWIRQMMRCFSHSNIALRETCTVLCES